MSRWFRHYAGLMRDEKLVRVALKAGQPVERVLWVWGAILESAAEIDDGGRFDMEAGEVAYFLRADEADIVSILDGLTAMGRICEDFVVKWGDRQFQSDRSAERQRRHRDKQEREPSEDRHGDGGVTAVSRHGDAPETETETEAKTEKKDIRAVASATRPDEFQEFWKAYPKRDGANPKEPARKKFVAAVKSGTEASAIITGAKRYAQEIRSKQQERTPYVAQAMTWLNQQRWGDYQPNAPPDDKPTPPPGAPSDEELRKRYATPDQKPEGQGVLREGGSADCEDGNGVCDQPRNAGVRRLGAVLQSAGLVPVRNDDRAPGHDQAGDDADPVAAMVRH
jgi:hypothetical protein